MKLIIRTAALVVVFFFNNPARGDSVSHMLRSIMPLIARPTRPTEFGMLCAYHELDIQFADDTGGLGLGLQFQQFKTTIGLASTAQQQSMS